MEVEKVSIVKYLYLFSFEFLKFTKKVPVYDDQLQLLPYKKE